MKNLAIYDNGGKTADRYTVVYKDMPERQPGTYYCLSMCETPFDPCGIGMHGGAMLGRHLGKRITFEQLPPDCQKLVKQDRGLV